MWPGCSDMRWGHQRLGCTTTISPVQECASVATYTSGSQMQKSSNPDFTWKPDDYLQCQILFENLMTRVPELDRALHPVLFLGGPHCVVETNVNYQMRVIINNLKKTNKAIFKNWDVWKARRRPATFVENLRVAVFRSSDTWQDVVMSLIIYHFIPNQNFLG